MQQDGLQKRPGESLNRGPPKRRATQACQTCRARKVRCDVSLRRPCTNCSFDASSCETVSSRRGPKPRQSSHYGAAQEPTRLQRVQGRQSQHLGEQPRDIQGQQASFHRCEQQHNATKYAQSQQHHGVRSVVNAPTTPFSAPQQPSTTTPSDRPPGARSAASCPSPLPSGSVHDVAAGLFFVRDPDMDDSRLEEKEEITREGSAPANLHDTESATTLGSHGHDATLRSLRTPSGVAERQGLPAFVRPLPTGLDEEDLAFLARKGALTVPEAPLRTAILKCYLSSVHPFLPVIDLKQFMDAVGSNGSTGHISLLLFQAVMFAGLATIDVTTLQRYSFNSTKHARSVLFARVRLLHDLVMEPDADALMQSLLLMSLWYGGPDDPRSTWYYTGLAWSTAQSIGLHRSPTGHRRRMFWSLFIRDRLIALATRRPMLIKDSEYNVAMLSVADFSGPQPDPSHAEFYDQEYVATDGEHSNCLHLMCVELAKLCVIVGHVLATFFDTLGRRNIWTQGLMIVPRDDLDLKTVATQLDLHHKKIVTWQESIHPDVRRVASIPIYHDGYAASNCLQQHWEILDMLRLTLISLLYRPRGFLPLAATSATNGEATELIKASRAKLKSAARELTRIGHTALLHGRVRFLTTSAIPAFLSAGLTHLLEVDSPDEDVRDASIFRFSQIVQTFQCLREVYASADSSITYLNQVIRKTGISGRIPQIAALAPEFRNFASGKRKAASSLARSPGLQSGRDTSAYALSDASREPHQGTIARQGQRAVYTTLNLTSPTSTRMTPRASLQNAGAYMTDQNRLQLLGSAAMANSADVTMPEVQASDTLNTSTGLVEGSLGDSADLLSLFGQGPLLGPCGTLDYDVDLFDFGNNSLDWLDHSTSGFGV